MSNSVFQSVIIQLRDISDRTFGVIDTEGCVVSCTDMTLLGERWPDAALKVGNASEGLVTFAQKTFKAMVGNSNYFEYAVFCTGCFFSVIPVPPKFCGRHRDRPASA